MIPHANFEKLFLTVLDGRGSIKLIGILLERLGKWKINNQVGRQSRLLKRSANVSCNEIEVMLAWSPDPAIRLGPFVSLSAQENYCRPLKIDIAHREHYN